MASWWYYYNKLHAMTTWIIYAYSSIVLSQVNCVALCVANYLTNIAIVICTNSFFPEIEDGR